MSNQSLALPSTTLARRRWRKWIAAMVLAASLAGLPVLASGPFSPLFAQAVQAGCNLGGTCG